jgi:thioredoxin-related protein
VNQSARPIGLALLIATLGLLLPTRPALAQEKQKSAGAAKKIYDEQADAKADIAAALAKAGQENTRVLVMFGGNWCGWCHRLHDLFQSDRDIRKILLYEYQLVMVDIGRWNKHMDLAEKYGADLKKHGVPFLTILDADAKVLANQETGSLEIGPKHSPDKVKALLNKHVATPRDAREVVTAALAKAKSEDKLVFLHLGAPWCPWCHKLDDFLAREDIADILSRDYLDLKIDVDRMTHGKEVARKYRGGDRGGIPWFTILDPQGKSLGTADGPQGNIGFPVEPHEIAHFIDVLKKTAKRISAEQIELVEQALQASAKEIKARRGNQGP